MRVPPFDRYRSLMQLASVFVFGMIVGSIFYNVIFQMSYNHLWLTNKDLQIQIEQYKEDIKTLKKYNNRPTVIKEIKVRVEEPDKVLDSLVVKEIVQKLQKDLEVLRGRNIFEIDSDSRMTRILLDRKIYSVRDKDYSIQIKTMLVMEGVLQIWVELKEYVHS
ncbi:hypothetical protein PASE110613_09990 [Paenibacillus sediminis]|uniref:Sporulation membrane protein YtrI C-terminal domain-containing protein n=1 Tax=Paenibacillus sediminis TaxID=664909 RepID=A0ABS4H5L8_9BACL|nr:hypothetical protein [Paenibacillus sediminis]MBP1937817.1 hypothetical protein [Paenibacillus sediminis]